MKLARLRNNNRTIPILIVSDNEARDCSALTNDWDGSFYKNDGLQKLATQLEADVNQFPLVDLKNAAYDSSIPRPEKILCIGLNYRDHAEEAGMEIPKEPITFMKATSALSGPNDPILKPRKSRALDWEVELGVVIGKNVRYLDSEEEAKDCIAGYTIAHDVSERVFQIKHGGQWNKGKSHDSFCPTGPWVVTPDEIADPQNLTMTLTVNGITRQNGNTNTMIFSVSKIIHYVSQFMTLEAGDLIITGTPPGVGSGMKPPTFLNIDDVVSLKIEGLGQQTQTVIKDE